MNQILGTLSLGPLEAIVALCLAVFWAWRIVGLSQGETTFIQIKTTIWVILRFGLLSLWPSANKPELLNPTILALLSLCLLASGSSFDIPVFGYGFCLMVGFVVAIALAAARARHVGIDPNHILDLGMLAVALGVLGARLFYYVQHYESKFAERPLWDFIAVWEGGIVYYGGLIFATLGSFLYLRYRAYRILKVGDTIAPSLAIGLSFGRIGCFFNGCCWGRVCEPDAVMAVQFPRESFAWWQHIESHSPTVELQAFQDGHISVEQLLGEIPPELHDWSLFVHPTQVYSWALSVLVAIIILIFERWKSRREGQSLVLFFVLYAPARFVLEMFRGDSEPSFDSATWTLTSAQIISLIIFPIALGLFGFLMKVGRTKSLTVDLPKDLDVVD